MDNTLYKRAVQAAARARAARVAAGSSRPEAADPASSPTDKLKSRVAKVVKEIKSGQSAILMVEDEQGDRLVVKLVQMSNGLLSTCPIAFPPGALNIFPVFDVFAWRDGYGFVMPLAESSLRQWLRDDEESFKIENLISVLRDIATALASIEGKMVHGDLKPENVLRYKGKWCLADFGPSSCRLSFKERGEYSLTPAYAAPEQWKGQMVTSSTDLYAFGIIAFELLNGMRPFPGPSASDYRRQHLYQTPPPLLGMPSGLVSLVASCLQKDPADRPTATEVLTFLLPSGLGAGRALGGLAATEEGGPTAALMMEDSESQPVLAGDSFR